MTLLTLLEAVEIQGAVTIAVYDYDKEEKRKEARKGARLTQ